MSAPSLLADNPSARIEIVQGGGGMAGGAEPTFSADELKILTQYGLESGGNLDDVILPTVKKQFLEQLSKSNCAIGTGENVILNSECSAVAQVIRAMIIFNMKRTNGWGPKTLKISAKPPRVPGASQPAQSQPVQPPPIPGQPIDRDALIATIRSRIDERHNGLVNCGATCYLNSCLQMFSYVPELINETSKNQSLYSIFNDLYKLPLQKIDLDTRINNRLSLFNGMFPNIKTQQDVTEFMSRFYERFQLDAPYFKIRQIQNVICVNPPPSDLGLPGKTPVETIPGTITLSIQNGDSIQALLANIQRPNPLVNVEDCLTPGSGEARGPATQETRFEIPEENRYLVVSLSRFRDTGRTEKDAQGRIIPVFERIDTPIEINRQIEVGGVEYQLYGSILHTGNVKGGHYRFLKLKSDFSGSIIYNDETVTEQSSIPDIRVDTYVAIYNRMNIPADSPAASPAPSSIGATVNSSEEAENEENNSQSRMSAVPENPFANNVPEQNPWASAAPAPASAAPIEEVSVNYPDEYYEENPSNFQAGHLRMKFNDGPGNRRVYANTTVGTRRTRIYGTNAANIKRKFNSRTRKLKAAANRAAAAAATAARVASETRNAAQKAKNTREAAARAAAEAKKTLRTMETTAAKQAAANEKAAIRAKIAAGEKVSFMNRMRAKFGGSRRTRRKSRKSRRGGRK